MFQGTFTKKGRNGLFSNTFYFLPENCRNFWQHSPVEFVSKMAICETHHRVLLSRKIWFLFHFFRFWQFAKGFWKLPPFSIRIIDMYLFFLWNHVGNCQLFTYNLEKLIRRITTISGILQISTQKYKQRSNLRKDSYRNGRNTPKMLLWKSETSRDIKKSY